MSIPKKKMSKSPIKLRNISFNTWQKPPIFQNTPGSPQSNTPSSLDFFLFSCAPVEGEVLRAGQFCVLANSASSMLQHVSNELKASLIQTIKSCFYASGKKLQRLQRNILASKKRIWNRNLKPETAIAVCLFLEKYEPFIWNPRFSCPDRSPQHLHLKHLCFTPKARTWLWEPFGVVETSPLRNRKFMEKPKAPKSDVHQSFLHMFNS